MIDLRNGDCLEIMKGIPDNSVDLILTDPPYELNFMGKKWDNTGIAFNIEVWKEAYRVLKPGGYCMAFSGTRTYHRMAVAIEDAGFEIKDMIEWVYSTGFPKALDISKALDKKLGIKREVIGSRVKKAGDICGKNGFKKDDGYNDITLDITKPASDIAKLYEGYKTQLKPAHEPICLAMKPLSEKTFAENVMKWGTGGLNIDGTRIGYEKILINGGGKKWRKNGAEIEYVEAINETREGRFPANFIISEDVAPVLDKQSGYSKSVKSNMSAGFTDSNVYGTGDANFKSIRGHNDEGGASRFFYNAKIEEEDYIPFCYTAKASKKERNSDIRGNQITGELKGGVGKGMNNSLTRPDGSIRKEVLNVNNHATVKPKSILTYLLKLGLPPQDSVVLDLFAGSGSLGLAIADINKETGRNHKAILIEKDEEHCKIIKKRCCL